MFRVNTLKKLTFKCKLKYENSAKELGCNFSCFVRRTVTKTGISKISEYVP